MPLLPRECGRRWRAHFWPSCPPQVETIFARWGVPAARASAGHAQADVDALLRRLQRSRFYLSPDLDSATRQQLHKAFGSTVKEARSHAVRTLASGKVATRTIRGEPHRSVTITMPK
jgi:hypothetical protein